MTRRPVTILGGYLGAGKTTLVNHLLRHADGRRIAVLVNDFGALPIDADLIVGADAGLLSLAGGCVCCSYGDDLMQALMDLTARTPAPDHVLIETSGVALPGAVARSLTLLFDYRLDAIVVLADSETTEERMADRYMGDTLARQFADADVIVLNKCDLVDEASIAYLRDRLAHDYPQARLVQAVQSALALEVILGLDAVSSRRIRGGTGSATLEHAVADFTFTGTVDIAALARILPTLPLVRAKGFVLSHTGEWQSVQLAGRRVEVEPAPHGIQPPSRIVCIAVGGSIDKSHVHSALSAVGVIQACSQ